MYTRYVFPSPSYLISMELLLLCLVDHRSSSPIPIMCCVQPRLYVKGFTLSSQYTISSRPILCRTVHEDTLDEAVDIWNKQRPYRNRENAFVVLVSCLTSICSLWPLTIVPLQQIMMLFGFKQVYIEGSTCKLLQRMRHSSH